MALTIFEKTRATYHLGYPVLHSAGAMNLGIPVAMQTQFVLDLSLNLVTVDAEDQIRRVLQVLDNLECKLVSAQDRLAASKLGELTLERSDGVETDLLENEYYRWASRLSDILGAPLYPFSVRFKGRGGGVNVPVRH